MNPARATANANVALAKYWGKRDEVLNLPYTPSISLTLDGLETAAQVHFCGDCLDDRIRLNGAEAEATERERIVRFIELIRRVTGCQIHADVEVTSTFPVAAGLASSASTFAALALAASRAAGVSFSAAELSALARRGSGSAARSIHGGYVEWLAGESCDGADSYAIQLAPPDHWRLGVVIAITDSGRKRIGSREGMSQAVKHSPFFPAWLESHDADLEAVRQGVRERDLELVGRAAEHNCLKMHAVSMAAHPALLYWKPATLAVIERVTQLRHDGLDAYFTIDAGPQVKVICPFAQRPAIADALCQVDGVQRVLLSEPGAGARVVKAQ